ncbi:MAG: hydrogenase 4 membrane subunit [Anaerolineales bacterium]|jgi:hydrogenase-4 component E|nr:hydrogenase 4 membrane subunit [Anaerolineae bacterium]MBV6466709.1 Hydrogenase-4 component E [Anaerolineales bacterium]MDL1927175.1 hydrogenase 4 membrane subunit [Anaerolineae bacterium AMX1]GER79520.1 hydrogenase 4 membrane subunit [Candidatus Denitrolinea symbiosum]MCC7511419.1 hydrogenase 4 membrane subunit [Anaerolineae bacterium]
MQNVNLINSLSGLLILTSLLVIEAKTLRQSAIQYGIQSFVLVLIFLALASTMEGAESLYYWAASAFLTKAVLVPIILARAEKSMEGQPAATVRPWASIALAGASLVVSFLVVNSLQLRIAVEFKPALAVSIAHFFFGQLCILTQKNMLKQVLGFCLMENGSHLTLALLAYNAPELVEVGIATDAVFGVIIMVILLVQINKSLHTLDVTELKSLKG